MGVPAFFRWLTIRYPKVVIDAFTEADLELLEFQYEYRKKQGTLNSSDTAADEPSLADKIKELNPEIDNLYLDMNNIIHPCSHPPRGAQPQSEGEIFENIYAYIDKLIRLVKPQKLIYFAIDGVAPRAKLNQ
jgi:5'-3' exoribonuclease 2